MAREAKSKASAKSSAVAAASAKGGSEKTSPGAGAAGAASGPSVEELFKALDRHAKADESKQVIKISDQILQLSPGDRDASECKVVACIQLDEFDQALSFIDGAPGIDLTFHKAYCLYKRNRGQEALDCLRHAERSADVLQLEAQILFKLGNFGSCISSYQELLQNYKLDSDEVKSNIIAAYVSGGRSGEVQALIDSMRVSARSDYNLAFNVACALIERGEFSKAEEHLLVARRIGQEVLIEDEYPEEEIEDELAPISVQLSYVHQVQGHSAEALEGYNALIKRKPADEPSMAVAVNNLITLRGARDLFDALKKFDKLFEKSGGQRLQFPEKLEQRLSTRQKEAISFNRFLLLLHSNKLSQARELLPVLLECFPDSEIQPMLAASLALKEGKPARAEDVVEQYAVRHPQNSTPVYLVLGQMLASSGNYSRAADYLDQIAELQHRPGMVATLVELRERAGELNKAEAILDAAVEWWDNHMGDDLSTSEKLVQEAASFKLRHQKLQNAANLFERLTHSSSPAVRAEAFNGLVRSTALSDPAKAESYEQQLPPLPGLGNLNLEALEKSTPTASKRVRPADEEMKSGEERAGRTKPKKKRKKKPLYPKNFDPENPGPPPDPERWLPKRERSSYRPKKKDKRAQQVRGAQGSVSREKASDASSNGPHASSGLSKPGGSSSVASRTATPEPSKPSSSSHQRNKKKGRR